MSKTATNILILTLLTVLLISIYTSISKKIPIRYNDEHHWIARSYYFDLFLKGDFSSPEWTTSYSYDQPKVGNYLYGLTLYPYYLSYKSNMNLNDYDMAMFLIDHNYFKLGSEKYVKYIDPQKGYQSWEEDDIENNTMTEQTLLDKYGANFKKTINLLFLARSVNIYVLSLTAVISYYIIYYLTKSSLLSAITTILFSTNTLVVNASLRAHSEGIFLFFFNLSLLLMFHLLLSFKTKKIYYLLLGIILGFLTQTKLNGAMLLIIFNILIILRIIYYAVNKKASFLKSAFIRLFLVNTLCIFTFVILEPLILRSPLKNTYRMYSSRNQTSIDQISTDPPYMLSNFGTRILRIYSNFLDKRSYQPYNKYIFSQYLAPGINEYIQLLIKVFLVVGSLSLLYNIFSRSGKEQYRLFVIIFFLVQIIMGFYLRLDWDRYYIQLVLFFCFVEAVGIYNFFLVTYLAIARGIRLMK